MPPFTRRSQWHYGKQLIGGKIENYKNGPECQLCSALVICGRFKIRLRRSLMQCRYQHVPLYLLHDNVALP
jgi:hypothetical protein